LLEIAIQHRAHEDQFAGELRKIRIQANGEREVGEWPGGQDGDLMRIAALPEAGLVVGLPAGLSGTKNGRSGWKISPGPGCGFGGFQAPFQGSLP
jgi:hypothetical protein